MNYELLVTLIGSLGFPMVVALWYMVVSAKKEEATAEAINRMAIAIENNTKLIDTFLRLRSDFNE